MRRRFGLFYGVLIVLALISAAALAERFSDFLGYSPSDKEYYLTDEQVAFIRPGLDLAILDVSINEERRIVVTFSIKDPKGMALDINGVDTPGPVSPGFLFAYIPQDRGQYFNYNTRRASSSVTGITTYQPTSDSGGTIESLGDGVYVYTGGKPLPEDYDQDATHTVGAYARRDLREFGLDRYASNAIHNWVPSGAPVTKVREVVVTENCNECHNPLEFHGGSRKETGLCIMCHTPEAINAGTGNTVDFKVMIHKIHMGENLPSVEAGTPYQIISSRGTVHDYSEVAFPQDIRNCEKCHKNAEQGSHWFENPTQDVCGSCHDHVNFQSGENHAGGPQISDNLCASCHFPEGELEFDASVKGAHTRPYLSTQLKGIVIEILSVSGAAPGQPVTVLFTVAQKDGTPIVPADMPFFNLVLAGPTTDYSTLIIESARGAVAVGDAWSHTFAAALPDDASGSYVVGAETYQMTKLNAGTTKEVNFRETAENPVFYFAVTDAEPVVRRAVVSDEKCEACHENLNFHGTIRHDPEYCVTCHIPSGSDVARRPAEDMPAQSRHFKFMIHRIHRGHDLEREFTIYGFGGTAHTYNELHFPGDLRDCESCHVNDSYAIPLPEGVLPTVTEREFFSPMPPVSAACIGCHDSLDASAHAFTMIAPFGEACAACHGSGAEFAVERVHARIAE